MVLDHFRPPAPKAPEPKMGPPKRVFFEQWSEPSLTKKKKKILWVKEGPGHIPSLMSKIRL